MAPAPDPAFLVLQGATVLDGTGGPPKPDVTVVVRDGRMAHVGEPGSQAATENAVVEDLRGKVLLPGLIDAHAHAEEDGVLALLLAAGITQIRNPALCYAAEPSGLLNGTSPRPGIQTAGPAIDLAPSTVLGCVAIRDEAELRAEVRRQAAAGVDYVKLYTQLPPQLVAAGIDEAHRHKLKAIGDLGQTSWVDAARAGIDFLAHALPRQAELLPESTRASYAADRAARRPGTLWRWFELVDLDGPEITALLTVLVDHGVVVDPTLVGLEALLFAEDGAYRAEIGRAEEHLPVDSPLRLAKAPAPPAALRSREARQAIWRKVLGLVGRLHAAGVGLLAGTDTPRPGVVPGASLWRELSWLASAGLSADEALRVATGGAAELLGLGERAGVLAPGRPADLVVLDEDPRVLGGEIPRIDKVMQAGRYHQPAELRAGGQ